MKVLGLVPYFSGTSSATNSAMETRRQYLEATVESLDSYDIQVVVGIVQDEPDVEDLGLDAYRVEEGIPPEWLPVAFLREMKDNSNDFDLIYYTEADQILHIDRDLFDFPRNIRYLVPHRMEELYEGVGAERGDGFFDVDENRKFVIANGRSPLGRPGFTQGQLYKPKSVVDRFGGAWLASQYLYAGTQFRQSFHLPVEHACFGIAEAGTTWKTMEYDGFWVEHLSGIEYHEKLYRARKASDGTLRGGLEAAEETEAGGEAVDVQVSEGAAALPGSLSEV